MKITKSIAFAAGKDAGNRNMRANNRKKWNEDDWEAASKVTIDLLDKMKEEVK